MAIKTFDPKKVIIAIGGVSMSGFADGSYIKVARDGDSFMKKVGVDGEVSRARNNDRSGSIVLTLMQTSASNDVLSAFNNVDEQTNDGIVPVLITDLSGRSTFFSGYAWIKKPADSEFGKEVGTREWTLDTGSVDVFVGGN